MHANLWMSRLAMVAAMTLVAASLGCARQMHRRPAYGVANHTFFDRQAEATATGHGPGLDPEEASMILEHYREALGGKAAKGDERSQVLILQEDGDADTSKN